jgi:bifunctional non-homologous end joining protein LigD
VTPAATPAEIRLRSGESLRIPVGRKELLVSCGKREVKLTNLTKVFFPELGLTKRDLLQYYADVAELLLPHLKDRAMVMKRFPNGIHGQFFFMKRTPAGSPPWVECCTIRHGSGNIIDFPVANHLIALLWLVNLGCIDLNPWYSRCDDIDRPDFLHFDLDPVPPAGFERVREVALLVRDQLGEVGARSYAKTTGSSGIHVYVPIVRGPLQKQVWSFAKSFALEMARRSPQVVTAEYRVARRPPGRVLVDYNQNAWGRTLASVYSVRPRPGATVSMPVTWEEVESGVRLEDFTLLNAADRLAATCDLWRPLLHQRGRFDLAPFL